MPEMLGALAPLALDFVDDLGRVEREVCFQEIGQRPPLAYIGEAVGDPIGEDRPPDQPVDAPTRGVLCRLLRIPLERLPNGRRQDVN
jgi:hypothetical protein